MAPFADKDDRLCKSEINAGELPHVNDLHDAELSNHPTPEEYEMLFSTLSADEFKASSLLDTYVAKDRSLIVLFCQNSLKEEMFFLCLQEGDKEMKILLPADNIRDLSGKARKIFKLLPREMREYIQEYYGYLFNTRTRKVGGHSSGRSSAKGSEGTHSGIHRRRTKKPMR